MPASGSDPARPFGERVLVWGCPDCRWTYHATQASLAYRWEQAWRKHRATCRVEQLPLG